MLLLLELGENLYECLSLKTSPHLTCVTTLPCEISRVLKATIENKTISVTTYCKNLTAENNLFIVSCYIAVFTSNVQCVCLAAGRRTQVGDATGQWHNQPNAATVCHTQWHYLLQLVDYRELLTLINHLSNHLSKGPPNKIFGLRLKRRWSCSCLVSLLTWVWCLIFYKVM